MNYTPIVYKNKRILMTSQLAVSYETDEKRISENYNRNKDRYTEGKHYFFLEGEELKKFKKSSPQIAELLKFASSAYLWTEKGSWLHAKSLNTDKSWEAYEMLVDDYFTIKEVSLSQNTPSYMIEDEIQRAERWIEERKETKMLEFKLKEASPKVAYYDTILKSKGTVTTSQIAKDYGLSAASLNNILHEAKIQYKQNKQWLLYSKHADKGYTQSYAIDFNHKDGTPDVKMNTRWTQRGRIMIHELLISMDIRPNIDKEYPDVN